MPYADPERRRQYVRDHAAANREKHNQSSRKYYAANQELIRQRDRERHAANREQRNQRSRDYYAKNRQLVRQRQRERYANDPERRKRINRKWRESNPERARQASRNWLSANRERRNELCNRAYHKRRARLNNIQAIPFTAEQWAAKVRYWGDRCWRCGGDWSAMDHVKPVAAGGAHALCNVRPICKSCNSSKRHNWPLLNVIGVHVRIDRAA